jgi:2-polyprenyl-6-methoxyphenol hydroxylase-like FAD-dependent oxidoreductase
LQILISGAGIAGAALACMLARDGHEVTVVERDQGLRSSGNPVDVRGPAYDVVAYLGLLTRLRDLATHVRKLVFVDAAGRRVASISTRRSDRELEVPRADLCALLVESARGVTDFRFDDTVTSLDPDDHGVDVFFERGRPDRFDLVVGADGLHSTVRRLAFGPENAFVTHLGIYIATMLLPTGLERDDTVVMHNQPGAAVALHPGSGQAGAAFMFRSSAQIDPRDQDGITHLMARIYDGMAWRAPELLDNYLAAGDRYFDAISRVRVPTWTRRRVVLLGDAASCVSLFGEGSSSAIAGAAALARALAESPRDVARALLRYQVSHQALARRGQRGATIAAHLLIPATRTGIILRNQALCRTGHR